MAGRRARHSRSGHVQRQQIVDRHVFIAGAAAGAINEVVVDLIDEIMDPFFDGTEIKLPKVLSRTQSNRKRREMREAAGVCTNCGRSKGKATTKQCDTCRNHSNEVNAIARQKRKAKRQNKEFTGLVPSKKKPTCSECVRERQATGKPKTRCKSCKKRQRVSSHKSYERAVALGLCTNCRAQQSRPNRIQCQPCADKEVVRRTERRLKKAINV